MAAGIVYHNITTSSGVTFTIACWVPDTTAPDVGAIAVNALVNSAGTPLATGSGSNGVTVLRTALATDSPGIITTGTAGSASAQVLSVQGIASMTPLLVTPTANSAINLAQVGGASVALGSAVSSSSIPVAFATDQAGNGTATFTCGTTAYAALDVVGASGANAALDFGVVGASARSVMITGAALEIDTTALISGETGYLLYLYNVTPPSAINDSSTFDLPAGDRTAWLGGPLTFATPTDLGSTLYTELNGVNKQVLLAGTHLFGYLVSVGAYTPTARVFKLTLTTVQL